MKWSSAHLQFIVFFRSVETHRPTGKIRCQNRLSRCQNPSIKLPEVVCHRSLHKISASQIPVIVNSPLNPGFFQKIAPTHRFSLMMPYWRLPRWKRVRKNNSDDTYQVRAFVTSSAVTVVADVTKKSEPRDYGLTNDLFLSGKLPSRITTEKSLNPPS